MSTPEPNLARKSKAAAPLLPAENPIELAEPGTIDETINQRRLREFYELEAHFYETRDRYEALKIKMKDLLIHGAAIQTGTFKIRGAVRRVRRPKYKQVVIDLRGKDFQQEILRTTRPHEHFRIWVE